MSGPSAGAQSPVRTLSGTLAKTPMPRLLVSASSARVTGTLELACEGGESATIVFARGQVVRVKTTAPVAYLGSVLYELGTIDDKELNESLAELARTRWLHGEILLTRGSITPEQLAEGLHEQTARKLVHTFALPPETQFSFDADVDRLATWGGTDWPHVDPIAAVWRGIRDGFGAEDVESAMSRVRTSAFKLVAGADPSRFELSDVERSAVECLRVTALTLDELTRAAPIEAKRGRALAYFLLVTRQAEIVDTSGVRPAYRPSTPPTPSMAPSMPPSIAPAADGASRTRPTVREMPAAMGASAFTLPPHARPTTKLTRPPPELTESAKWRAVGPSSSTKMPVAPSVAPRESSRWPASSPARTVGGVEPEPATTRRSSPVPPRTSVRVPSLPPPNLPPASGSMRAAPMASSAGASSSAPPRRRSVAPSLSPMGRPSQAVMAAVAGPELAARRSRVAERARSILREDYFQRLSLTRDASGEQIDAAFEALRTLWDPSLLPPALDDAKDDSAFVMTCLAEAYATLRDPEAREAYAAQLGSQALRAFADQQADDLAASGSEDPWAGAQACFARGDHERAERLARRAVKASPEAGAPLALLAWLEALKPGNQSAADTRPRVAMLDRALRLDESLEVAWYWRAMLHKRMENHQAAIRDFRRAVAANPKNIDATRELRLYEMRLRRNSISMKGVK